MPKNFENRFIQTVSAAQVRITKPPPPPLQTVSAAQVRFTKPPPPSPVTDRVSSSGQVYKAPHPRNRPCQQLRSGLQSPPTPPSPVTDRVSSSGQVYEVPLLNKALRLLSSQHSLETTFLNTTLFLNTLIQI